MKKLLSTFLTLQLLASALLPIASYAETNEASIQAKLDLIAKLTSQINDLKSQIEALRAQTKDLQGDIKEEEEELLEDLHEGSQGDKVKILQALLASDSNIYPEGFITGYFGKITAEAVRKFQKRHNLPQVGRVGPLTRKVINELLKDGVIVVLEDRDDEHGSSDNKGKKPCAIVPPGHLIAPGWLRKNENAKPIVPPCQTIPPGIAKKLGLGGTTTPPTPDITAPTVSSVTSSPSSTGVFVTWKTDERSSSRFYYSSTTPVNASSPTTPSFSDNNLTKEHVVNLNTLSSATAYYFIIVSKDLAGNTSTSSQFSFTTLAVADVTPPVISNIVGSSISTTGATITWTTNETSNSKLYYSTTLPIDFVSAATKTDSSMTASHSLVLTELVASTTYYFAVESKDASGNTATSSALFFTTAAPNDTTAPLISNINSSAVGSTTATIGWSTNESSNSKIYYGTESPLSLSATTTLTFADGVLVTSHSLSLSSLTASTTYRYVVESRDTAGNTATSSENSFSTSQ